MKVFAGLGTFLLCLRQTSFIAKDLKLSKRKGTSRNISPCIKKANQGKKGKCQHKQEQTRHSSKEQNCSVYFGLNSQLIQMSRGSGVYLKA